MSSLSITHKAPDFTPRRFVPYQPYAPEQVIAEMTAAEYHAFLRTAPEKYEYVHGKLIKMSGASPEHNRIAKNLLVELDHAFETHACNCEVFGSDQKLFVSDTIYYLADVVVVCGEEQFDADDCLRNPLAIIEVISPSTERNDRTVKFRNYQKIASLGHYLLVEQDTPSVTHYIKLESGLWAIAGDHTDLTDAVSLALGGDNLSIPLARIYRRVDFAAARF